MLLTGTLAPWIHVRIITFLTVTHTVVKFPTPKYNSVFCSGPNYTEVGHTLTKLTCRLDVTTTAPVAGCVKVVVSEYI